jgi:spore maturation protein SpmB
MSYVSANDKVVLGFIGTGGRGRDLIKTFAPTSTLSNIALPPKPATGTTLTRLARCRSSQTTRRGCRATTCPVRADCMVLTNAYTVYARTSPL